MWNDLWAIGLTGAAVGGALGWPLVRRPTAFGPAGLPVRLLGVMFLVGGAAIALISIEHGRLMPPVTARLADHAVYASDMVFWALLVLWVRSATGVATSAAVRTAALAFSLAAYAAIAAGHGFRLPGFIWLLPAGVAAAAYATMLWRRARGKRETLPQDAVVTRMVAFAIALNVAQAIRTFWPQVEALREIVPLTMTGGFLSFAELATRSLFAKPHVEEPGAPRYEKSGLDEAAARQLLDALDRGMRQEHWYRDPSLTLSALAARLGARPHDLSQALNQIRGTTFNECLAGFRVEEARRLLADAESLRITIDALAEAAGFASRSAFYKAFKTREGITPTEYRRRLRANA